MTFREKRSYYESTDSESDETSASANAISNSKYNRLDEMITSDVESLIRCNQRPCNGTPFSSISEYEQHYNQNHKFICITCNRVLPFPKMLDLHIMELHDSFFKSMVDRGMSVFECFVEKCPQKFTTTSLRKNHLLTDHCFPPDYDFDIILGSTLRNFKSNMNTLFKQLKKKPDTLQHQEDKMEIEGAAKSRRKNRKHKLNTKSNIETDQVLESTSEPCEIVTGGSEVTRVKSKRRNRKNRTKSSGSFQMVDGTDSKDDMEVEMKPTENAATRRAARRANKKSSEKIEVKKNVGENESTVDASESNEPVSDDVDMNELEAITKKMSEMRIPQNIRFGNRTSNEMWSWRRVKKEQEK
ncbi:hypothetical protein HK098_001239 [Nowakowskiella sp. JEL0407]|nr:hypothetical protein HK098_001239 [Nowakowskiella sp. JEL0407]